MKLTSRSSTLLAVALVAVACSGGGRVHSVAPADSSPSNGSPSNAASHPNNSVPSTPTTSTKIQIASQPQRISDCSDLPLQRIATAFGETVHLTQDLKRSGYLSCAYHADAVPDPGAADLDIIWQAGGGRNFMDQVRQDQGSVAGVEITPINQVGNIPNSFAQTRVTTGASDYIVIASARVGEGSVTVTGSWDDTYVPTISATAEGREAQAAQLLAPFVQFSIA